MADSDIIKEFLVSLGFKVDQNTLKKMDSALVKSTKAALAFGSTLLAVALTATKFVESVADDMEDLYWSSVRLHEGAAKIQDFALGAAKMGGTVEGATAALEGMAAALRTNPAAEGFLNNLGVVTRDAEGNLRGTIDIVKDLANLPVPYWLKANFAAKFGISEKDLQAIVRAAPEAENAMSEFYKSMGINADEATAQSRDFKNELRTLSAELDVLGVAFAQHLMPFVRGFVAIATTAVYWIGKLDAATDGWTSTLLTIAVVAGGIALLFGWIPATIALLGFLATAIIGNWDKVKNYISNSIEWLRSKYNAAAKLFGLPLWGEAGPAKQDPAPVRGGADFRQTERNLGANSQTANDNSAHDQNVTGTALAFFQKMGWTANQAAGIVANLLHESGLNSRATGDNGKAFGIAQWHKDRQDAFKAWAGHDIHNSTLQEQLAFVNHELVAGAEKFAGKMLAATTTAVQAGQVVSKYDLRPADQVGQMVKRGNTAANLVSGAKLAPGRGSSSNITVNQKTDIKVTGSDPESTARAVGREQSRVNGDVVRNFAGAAQ